MTDGSTVNSADKENSAPVREAITLHLDNGVTMEFAGRQFAGGSWYDEENSVLTKQNWYVTDENEHVYSIVTGQGHTRSRRAYRVSQTGDVCTFHDGRQEISMELDMLIMAVRALAGIEADANLSVEALEDILRAANA